VANENGKTLAGVVSELKDEVKEFASTRVEMFKSEMKEKVSSLKTAVPLIAIALVLGLTAWFVLTAALVSIVATAFYPSRFAYFFALVIVSVVYLVAAGVMGAFAVRELKEQGVLPERTLRVLKEDQAWLQNEARQQV
jgi:uncharacterized membrane protein YqjE